MFNLATDRKSQDWLIKHSHTLKKHIEQEQWNELCAHLAIQEKNINLTMTIK